MVLWIPRQDVGIDEGIMAGSTTVNHIELTTYWNRDTLAALTNLDALAELPGRVPLAEQVVGGGLRRAGAAMNLTCIGPLATEAGQTARSVRERTGSERMKIT